MKVQFELVIGENKYILSEDVETHADFFKKLNFYSGLPKTAPGGATDLVLRFRKAKTKAGKDCEYYSIVSQKEKVEYKFGQSQGVVGGLFPKGWEALFNAGNDDGAEDGSEDQAPAIAPGQSVGLGAPAPAAQAAKPAAAVASSGLGAPAAKAPTPAPAATNTAAAPAGAVPSQVQNQAKNVLSKFGI